jgi:hypothetical protein
MLKTNRINFGLLLSADDTFAVGMQVSTTIDPATRDAKFPTYKASGVSYTTPLLGNKRIVHSEAAEENDWNTVELVLDGGSAIHIVNGHTTMRVTNVRAPAAERGQVIAVRKGRILCKRKDPRFGTATSPINR